jgi:MHS family proline/betaine transporter-like MFS transporter
VRHGIPEPISEAARAGSPLAQAARGSWKQLLQGVGLNAMGAVVFYTVFIYMATWLVEQVGETHAEALDINSLSMLVMAVTVALAALASDRVGRKPFLLIGSAGIALFGYPLVWLMHHPDPLMLFCGQAGLAFFLGCFSGVIPVTMAELFPRQIRVSAASVSYNLPYAVFGGTAPMVATWLVTETGDAMSITGYLIGLSVLGFLVALTLPERRGVDLNA